MTIKEMVVEARRTISDFRQVPGNDDATTADKQSAAQKMAEQYLSQGFFWLKKVGESTVAAIFVTLGSNEFSFTPAGKLFFGGMDRELDEDAEDVPYGWSAVQEYCQFGPRLQPIVEQAVKAHAGDFLVRTAFVASRIMPKKKGE